MAAFSSPGRCVNVALVNCSKAKFIWYESAVSLITPLLAATSMTSLLKAPKSSVLGIRVLAYGATSDRYRVRLARDRVDLRAAQSLRFLVFNVELNEGLEESYLTCLDSDPFDEVCDHLVVEDLTTGDIVGTYRLQTGSMAQSNLGFYSGLEFDFNPLKSHL